MRSALAAPSDVAGWLAAAVLLAGVAGCGAHPSKPEPSMPPVRQIAVSDVPEQVLVRATYGGFEARPKAPPPTDLQSVFWSRVEFDDGRVTLGGLFDEWGTPPCGPVERIDIGPWDHGARQVLVLVPKANERCPRRGVSRVTFKPEHWSVGTIAAPIPLDVPNPRLTKGQTQAGIANSAVLQADHRSVVLQYEPGCADIADVRAHVRGSRVTINVLSGILPEISDLVCGEAWMYHFTFVRLPVAVPADAVIRVIPGVH